MRLSRAHFEKAVLARVKPSGQFSDAGYRFHSDLKRAIELGDQGAMKDHLSAAKILMDQNRFKGKDFALLLNSISKVNNKQSLNEELQDIISHLEVKVSKSPAFLLSLSPVDTAQLLNGLVKVNEALNEHSQKLNSRIINRITEQIPTKLPLYQDHHLAIVLHALAASKSQAFHVISEIVNEIENSRDLESFTPQGVVMIANALSRLKVRRNPTVVSLWGSIMKRTLSIRDGEMQPRWPGVILSAVSYAGLKPWEIQSEFLQRLMTRATRDFETGRLERVHYMKCLTTATNMGLTLHIEHSHDSKR